MYQKYIPLFVMYSCFCKIDFRFKNAWLLPQDSTIDGPDNLGESWGICSDKPRLPGRGFDYNELELTAAAVADLDQLPGCSFVGLQMIGNMAKRCIAFILDISNAVSSLLHGSMAENIVYQVWWSSLSGNMHGRQRMQFYWNIIVSWGQCSAYCIQCCRL
jgi:hypothetical protein